MVWWLNFYSFLLRLTQITLDSCSFSCVSTSRVYRDTRGEKCSALLQWCNSPRTGCELGLCFHVPKSWQQPTSQQGLMSLCCLCFASYYIMSLHLPWFGLSAVLVLALTNRTLCKFWIKNRHSFFYLSLVSACLVTNTGVKSDVWKNLNRKKWRNGEKNISWFSF